MAENEMQTIAEQVAAMELALAEIDAPLQDKGNPYAPVDRAWASYKDLKGLTYIPGMIQYLDRVLEVLLPIKLRLLQRTVKANWIFLTVLLAFPLVTLLFGMHFSITTMLFLPAIAWTWITYKARQDMQRTRARIAQIKPS